MRVRPVVRGVAVGIHGGDDPQVDAADRVTVQQGPRDRDAGVLVAVHLPEQDGPGPRVRVTEVVRDDLPAVHRTSQHLRADHGRAGGGPGHAATGDRHAQTRGDREHHDPGVEPSHREVPRIRRVPTPARHRDDVAAAYLHSAATVGSWSDTRFATVTMDP